MMSNLEQAARALLAHWDTPAWKHLKPTGDLMADLREALAEQADEIYWIETNKALAKEIIDLKRQVEQEPVAKEVLKYCTYFKCIDFEQTPPFLRYDTFGSTAKENFDEYCTIQECLREYGYELTDSDVDHDTVCGDVTPMPRAATVRTKDLTDDEIGALVNAWMYSPDGYEALVRAGIAADREKNK